MTKDKNQAPPDATGESKPAISDTDRFVEIVPLDPGDRRGRRYLLDEETSMDAITADENAEAVVDMLSRYTDDQDIQEDFEERQQLASNGRKLLIERLENNRAESPGISGGDLDADWESADAGGEEAVGGTVPTPDQDIVEELGQAVGLTYEDDEPLNSAEKLAARDQDRWELSPESVEETTELSQDQPSENLAADEDEKTV